MGIIIIKNKKLWMEENAIQQLKNIAEFKNVVDVAGLPDLHQGKTPVGATIKTQKMIYPFFIGNDIGCGMSLFDTNIKMKKVNIQKYIRLLENTKISGSCSIGGGNHFAELQMIDKIYDKQNVGSLNIDKNHLMLLIHSGSRKLGDDIYRQYASTNGLEEGTKEFDDYFKEHRKAIEYAKKNRMMIANALMNQLKVKYHNHLIIDCIHNYIEDDEGNYYHHKGTVSAWDPYAIIAGSRGTYSYIVQCIPTKKTLYSISHGAGRKWARHLCEGRLETKYKKDEMKSTQLGGRVICHSNHLLYEEASEAYKNIDDVIDTLIEYECIKLVARLKPLVTYKC